MEAVLKYISISCGRTPSALDCGPENYVAFAANNALGLILMPNDGRTRIVGTFAAHQSRINCVRWARHLAKVFDDKIISGAADGSAIIWKRDSPDSFSVWRRLVGHTAAVNAADALQTANCFRAVTASADSTVKIWKFSKENEETVQTISLGSGLCLSLQLFALPRTNSHVLACGFDDNNIHLFGEMINNQYQTEYVKLQILSGHEDWVRGLDSIRIDDDRVFLASCSQDTYVRLWSLDFHVEEPPSGKIQIEKKKICVGESTWTVRLEAVLSGHEGAVYGVHWNDDGRRPRLLSSSIDKSLIVWEQQQENEENDDKNEEAAWTESVRVGEVGGGGLGFYGGKFSADGAKIIGHGYTGSLHIWNYEESSDRWRPGVPCGGHFDEVLDLAWDPNGDYLLTVSADKTSRIHAPWTRDGHHDGPTTWHEIARPQVHGYDMSSVAVVRRFTFASGAEEKVIRVFEAPQNFFENFRGICGPNVFEASRLNHSLPEGAAVPSLGLSNKAVYGNESSDVDINEKNLNKQYTENRFIATKLEVPPTEETLMQNTLWPEQQKLYGHGYEVFALAASGDGKVLASACKASKPQHAAIIIWDTSTWIQTQSLESHALTVTQLRFSPDSSRLLSVSRDRRWSIFRRSTSDNSFALEATTDKTNGVHSRIIWACDWTPDSRHFATGSRDGKVVVWNRIDNSDSWKDFVPLTPILNLADQSVTALSFALIQVKGEFLLGAGFESGRLRLYSLGVRANNECEWTLRTELNNTAAHQLTVKRLAFRPASKKDEKEEALKLASCSSDHAVKIFEIKT